MNEGNRIFNYLCRNVVYGYYNYFEKGDDFMQHLEPLKQWICDTCGKVIEKPEDGYIIWQSDEDGYPFNFKIIHTGRCDDKDFYRYSTPLKEFLDSTGLVKLIALIDPGEHYKPSLDHFSTNKFRDWVTLVRRLQTPYFEEGRQYFERANQDELYCDCDESYPYLPESLQSVIDKYDND